jgi:DNA-binding NarL/FixJ family response regulator
MGESLIFNELISIMVVDDHLFIRNSLARLLRNFDFVEKIELAESGEIAIEILKQNHFDIVLMDNSMPNGMFGVDATLWITKNLPKINVIGITNLEIGNTGIQFVVNGAKGFFEKGLSEENLKKAIITVYNGGTYFSDDVQKKIITYNLGIESYKRVELTEREYQVIEYLSNALPTKHIADKLNLKVRRVEQIINEIQLKTDCKTPFQLAMFLTRNKYLK